MSQRADVASSDMAKILSIASTFRPAASQQGH
jgi:hypothetical protein